MTARKRIVLYSSSLLILAIVISGLLSELWPCSLQQVRQTLAEGFQQEKDKFLRQMKEQDNKL